MRSRHHLVLTSRRLRTRHCLNAQNVIDWKRNVKENIIKKYLRERTIKEVVIIRIESYFSAFH